MAVDLGAAAVVAVAVVTLAVAALVLFLDFGQRVHRAFALFLVLRAMMDGMLLIAQEEGPGLWLRRYWLIAVPFAALHFCLAYLRRHGRRQDGRPAWVAPALLLAAALAVEAAYFLDHGLFDGPLHVFDTVRFPAFAAVAWVFAYEHGRTPAAPGRRALRLASLGFLMTPLYFATFELSLEATRGTLEAALEPALLVLAVALVADAGRRLLASRRRDPWLVVALAAWPLLGLATTALFQASAPGAETVLRGLNALSALAVPLCITYALVKHRLFDAEVKLRFAVKGSTLAGMFLAVFFVVSQLAQNVLSTRGGVLVGGVVTGLVLFAIHPLQKLADRIASRAVPGTPSRQTERERLELYREQLEIAWTDGRLTAKERLLFARLQERLGIAPADAARLETEVVSALSAPLAPAPRRATPGKP